MKDRPDRAEILEILAQELPGLRERYGVVRMALYGSVAQDASTKESDVDLLVELSRPLGLEFVALAQHLEERLGFKVDLSTFETFRRSLDHPRYSAIARNIERTLTDVEKAA